MYVNGKFKVESNEAEVSAINGVATAISDKTIDFPESQLTSLETIATQLTRITTLQTPVQSDWNVTDTESLAYIKNKPTITTPVQSDWEETDTTSLSYIQNKPLFPVTSIITNNDSTFTVSDVPVGSSGNKYGIIYCGWNPSTLSAIVFSIGSNAYIGTATNHYVSTNTNYTGASIAVSTEWSNEEHTRINITLTFSATMWGGVRVVWYG